MTSGKNTIGLIFSFCLFSLAFIACNKDLSKIASIDHYNWARKGDSIQGKDTLTLSILNLDSIAGRYNFIVLPGFQGHGLQLLSDSTFIESSWADVGGQSRALKGKWRIENNRIILKSNFSSLRLSIHQYKWATFLIPEAKKSRFAFEFNRNIQTIDSLDPVIKYTSNVQIHWYLANLRTLCFIQKIKK